MRSRSAIITAIVAPLALAIVFGLMFATDASPSFVIGIVDEGGTPGNGPDRRGRSWPRPMTTSR